MRQQSIFYIGLTWNIMHEKFLIKLSFFLHIKRLIIIQDHLKNCWKETQRLELEGFFVFLTMG